MTSWVCTYCGGRVYGFEGERGRYVGVCKHCGQSYGLTRGIDKEVRAKYLLDQEIAEMDREAYRCDRVYSEDHEAIWYVSIVHHRPTSPIGDITTFDKRIDGRLREALDYAQVLSKKLDDKGEDVHVIVQIRYRTVAIYRAGSRMQVYVMVARWTSEARPEEGNWYRIQRGGSTSDYTEERAKAHLLDVMKNVREPVEYYGPMSIKDYDTWVVDQHRAQREQRIRDMEADIRKEVGLR